MAMRSKESYVTHGVGSLRVRNTIWTNNSRISDVGYPISSNDAATKKYVDDNLTSSEIYAGTGLNKVGTTFSVNNNLSHVTGLGNINSGTWSANNITIPYGGTGKTTFTTNKLIMGNGANPLVSISEVSFESNKLQSTAPIYISNTTNSTGIGSGGSLTILGGTSISGKLWVGNDINVTNNVNIGGNITVGNITINGTSSFTTITATDGTYTNSTLSNIINTNLTTSNIITTNLRTTNISTSTLITTNITSTNLFISNISTSTLRASNDISCINLSLTNISTSTIITTQSRSVNTTTTNLLLTNISGSSAIISNITNSNILSSSVTSTNINITNGNITSITNNNLIVNSYSILLNNTTTQNLFNTNLTSSNIQNINLNTSNITTNNLQTTYITTTNAILSNITTSNIITTQLTSTNITTNNIITTNITTSNINTTQLITQNITSSTLRISGISILTTINSNSLSTGALSVTGTTNLTNTTLTNCTVPNIANVNFTNTNSTTTHLNTTNITASNLSVTNIVTLGSVGSANLNTGNINSTGLSTFNDFIANTSTISNIRITGISILGSVNSNNLSTGTLFVGTSLSAPLINTTTQTTTNLLVTNVRSTNITSNSIQITGTSILTNVTSNNLFTGTLTVNSNSNLTNIIASNFTVSNIFTTSITSSTLNITNNANIHKTLNIGSNFSTQPSTTSGNILNISPSVFTDNTTNAGGTISLWATSFFSNSTLSAQNSITTQRACSIYLQGAPSIGANQTIRNSAALTIGYVDNQTGGNISGQIILERNDGNWYGSIFTESSTNKIVIANASLSGGGGIGLYTYTGTKITFADIPSATNFTPTTFLEFSNTTSKFYSTMDSTSKTSGSIILQGGLGVTKNITCDSISPTTINASIKTLQDVDTNMSPSNGQSLVWNGSLWSASSISGGGGGGSIGPTTVEVYPMNLVMPIMTSNGPETGIDGNYYVSASSEFSPLYAAYKCLSNITNPTDWATTGETSNFWIKVHLPTSQNVRYVLLEGRINNEDPQSITIQGSNDDSTYTDIITNETFTALNYTGYFSAKIPENSKNYTYYKFLFPSAAGINPGLNMLRLFKYDNTTYTEGILDNSSIEGNGKFNSSIINGRWPMAFELTNTHIVNIRAQITCFTSSAYVLRKFVMYINGSPFQNDGSTFIKGFLHQNIHTSLQTLEWTGSLPAGTHTISFFVDGGSGITFDSNDNIRVNIVKY